VSAYLRGVSVPPHVYAASAGAYFSSPRRPAYLAQCTLHRAETRAYTRVVLRLRAQAEAQAEWDAYYGGGGAPRPAGQPWPAPFRSALYHARRAPLLRVFVPSAEGDWLTDDGVLECEAELEKAGVRPFLREGDVVWDAAIGDEGQAHAEVMISLSSRARREPRPARVAPAIPHSMYTVAHAGCR
jgi:hypothetical protein